MYPDPAPELAALADLQRDEPAALNRIIERWQRPLQGFAYRYLQNSADAQDVVADAFVRLYQARAKLRPDTKLSAWLFTTLSNLCHNHHRWRRRHPTVGFAAVGGDGEAAAPFDPADGEPAPDEVLAREEFQLALRQAVEALPHDLKVTVLLHHYEQLAYREIAGILRCSERGVETRLYRARNLLRQRLLSLGRERPNL